MSPIVQHLHTMRGAIIGGALLVASSVAGLVWLSIAAVGGTAAVLGSFWAQIVVGLLLLSPLAIFALIAWQRDRQRKAAAVVVDSGGDAALSAAIAAATHKMIEKSPFAALALASLAGLISARFPAALSLLASVVSATEEPRDASE